ncbi:MAG TPA: DUF2147 domain-containing protein [Pelobium sp.]|nr:DUF2147 domain-containing protein [Pelobium sp.]
MPIQALCFQGQNDILGKWISTKKNVIIEVYKTSNQFQAKVLWFDDRDDLSRPMRSRLDIHNPNKNLRDQRILGMDILEGLTYNPEKHRWEKGKIYDPTSGRHWSSVVYFNKQKQLEVKGYWKFEFLCQTLAFVRYNKSVAQR